MNDSIILFILLASMMFHLVFSECVMDCQRISYIPAEISTTQMPEIEKLSPEIKVILLFDHSNNVYLITLVCIISFAFVLVKFVKYYFLSRVLHIQISDRNIIQHV